MTHKLYLKKLEYQPPVVAKHNKNEVKIDIKNNTQYILMMKDIYIFNHSFIDSILTLLVSYIVVIVVVEEEKNIKNIVYF